MVSDLMAMFREWMKVCTAILVVAQAPTPEPAFPAPFPVPLCLAEGQGSGSTVTQLLRVAVLQDHLEFQTAPVYVFCESYGGKVGAAFALAVSREVAAGRLQLNFQCVSSTPRGV